MDLHVLYHVILLYYQLYTIQQDPTSDGRYMINKTLVEGRSIESLGAALLLAAKAGKDSVIIISADASSTHQSVITVMEAARRNGFTQITFATQSAAQAGAR